MVDWLLMYLFMIIISCLQNSHFGICSILHYFWIIQTKSKDSSIKWKLVVGHGTKSCTYARLCNWSFQNWIGSVWI